MLLVSFNVFNYHVEYLYSSLIEDRVIPKFNHDQDRYFQFCQNPRCENNKCDEKFFYCDCPTMEPCTNL